MKISILSDLHCRNKTFPPSFDITTLTPADVLVIAGDIGTHVNYDKLVSKIEKETEGKFKKIICVKGNHDYYVTDHNWAKHHKTPLGPSTIDNFKITVKDNDGDVDFICTPMWSPILNNADSIRYMMNDYNYISGFTTDRCTDLFKDNLAWLEVETEESRKNGHRIVIVTHHLPIRELIDSKYAGSPINEAFCVIDDFFEQRITDLRPSLWIHGHSHNFMDITLDGTRYIRNPYGYEWKSHDYDDSSTSKEKTGYVHGYTIEI